MGRRQEREVEEDEDKATADVIHSFAHSMKSGRFGDDRVFINRLWKSCGSVFGLDLDDFKKLLWHLHRKDLITLARADLVEAMDPRDVEDSEIQYFASTREVTGYQPYNGDRPSATFHFVKIPPLPGRR